MGFLTQKFFGSLQRGLSTLVTSLLLSQSTAIALEKPENSGPPPQDLVAMRRALVQELTDWTLTEEAIKTKKNYRGLTRYWVVTLQPKWEGKFIVRYQFERSQIGYRPSDRQYEIVVGKKGCQRVIYSGRAYPDICLGDRIMVPIEINDQNFNYSFSRQPQNPRYIEDLFRDYSPKADDSRFNPEPLSDFPGNPLNYLGRNYETLSTAGGDLRIRWRALFLAQDSGKVNLKMRLNLSQELQHLLTLKGDDPDYRTGFTDEESVSAISIVPRNSSITTIAFRESAATDSSNQYLIRVPPARVGDRIWVNYRGGVWLARKIVWGKNVDQDKLHLSFFNSFLSITQLPFDPKMLDSDYLSDESYYDEWLPPSTNP